MLQYKDTRWTIRGLDHLPALMGFPSITITFICFLFNFSTWFLLFYNTWLSFIRAMSIQLCQIGIGECYWRGSWSARGRRHYASRFNAAIKISGKQTRCTLFQSLTPHNCFKTLAIICQWKSASNQIHNKIGLSVPLWQWISVLTC